jgi:hypothetical protein
MQNPDSVSFREIKRRAFSFLECDKIRRAADFIGIVIKPIGNGKPSHLQIESGDIDFFDKLQGVSFQLLLFASESPDLPEEDVGTRYVRSENGVVILKSRVTFPNTLVAAIQCFMFTTVLEDPRKYLRRFRA